MRSSNKLKSITMIRNKIIALINHNNEIKRLMYYMTSTPLEETGITNEGDTVIQEDISEVDFTIDEKRILPNFSNATLADAKVFVFVRRFECDLSDEVMGNNKIVIDIAVPTMYSILDEMQDRESLIANIICDIIDDEVIQSLGKIKVVHAKDSTIDNNKQFNVLTLFVQVPTLNTKNK